MSETTSIVMMRFAAAVAAEAAAMTEAMKARLGVTHIWGVFTRLPKFCSRQNLRVIHFTVYYVLG